MYKVCHLKLNGALILALIFMFFIERILLNFINNGINSLLISMYLYLVIVYLLLKSKILIKKSVKAGKHSNTLYKKANYKKGL